MSQDFEAKACPSIQRLEDGRLLIVGTYSPARARLNNVPMGEDETAIVIPADLLSVYVSDAVKAERLRCCKVLCEGCRDDIPTVHLNNENDAGHETSDGILTFCHASALRSRGGDANG